MSILHLGISQAYTRVISFRKKKIFITMKTKKSKSYDVLKRNNLENEINKCNDIELLKRLVDKLKNKVEETNKIIKEQKD